MSPADADLVGDPNPIGWMIDLEIALAKAFGWSLWEIDETDVESLVGFVNRFTDTQGKTPQASRQQKAYCDQVDWL